MGKDPLAERRRGVADERETIEQKGNRNVSINVQGNNNIIHAPPIDTASSQSDRPGEEQLDAARIPAALPEPPRPAAAVSLSPDKRRPRKALLVWGLVIVLLAGVTAGLLVYWQHQAGQSDDRAETAAAILGAKPCRVGTAGSRVPVEGFCEIRWPGDSVTLSGEFTMLSGLPIRIRGFIRRVEVTDSDDSAVLKLWPDGGPGDHVLRVRHTDKLWNDTRVLFSTEAGVEIPYRLSDVGEVVFQ